MASLLDLQQVCHIIEILRSGKVLVPVDSVLRRHVGICSCRGDRFVYLAAVLEIALHDLGIGFCMLPLLERLSCCYNRQ